MEFETLIQQPESRRDERWEVTFLDQFSQLKVEVESDQAKAGPDGWPYFMVRTGPEGVEPVTRMVQWLAGRGIGLVVNPHKMLPDYVFTYGMLWNFVETGRFVQPPQAVVTGQVVYGKDGGMLMGPPTEKYLPLYVRAVLKDFLQAQGFLKTKILVATTADFTQVDLLISIESLNQLPEAQHKIFAEMFAWFLPLHYNLVLASEQGLPAFYPL